jgi:hypothetical protein
MILADSFKDLDDFIHGMTYAYVVLLLIFALIASAVVSFVIIFVIKRVKRNEDDTDSKK